MAICYWLVFGVIVGWLLLAYFLDWLFVLLLVFVVCLVAEWCLLVCFGVVLIR